MLDVCFGGIVRRNDIARCHNLRPNIVTQIICCVATVWTNIYLNFSKGLAQFCEARGPSIFGSSMSFDESQERLALPLHPGLPMAATRSTWHCLVSSQKLCWSFGNDDDIDDWAHMDCLRAPVPVLTTSAESLMSGLYSSRQIKHLAECEKHCLSKAVIGFRHFDRDGATSNCKLVALVARDAAANTLISDLECSNHQNNLSDTYTTLAVDQEVVPWLYSASLFISRGGNSLRLAHAVVQLVDRYMPKAVHGDPPVEARAFSEKLKHFSMLN